MFETLVERFAEAETFNARIRLPVPWDVGIKDVLSGLSPSSWGNGYNRLTVHHILLLQGLPSDFALDGFRMLPFFNQSPHAMTKLTCPHCGHTFTAAELKALTKSVVHAYLQGIATSGEKLGSVMAATAKRASDATNARWKKYREEQAKHKEGK